MVGHGGTSAGSYLADPTSPIPSHFASIVTTSTVRVKILNGKCCSPHGSCSLLIRQDLVIYRTLLLRIMGQFTNADLGVGELETDSLSKHFRRIFSINVLRKSPPKLLSEKHPRGIHKLPA